jgi:hypothetical protein
MIDPLSIERFWAKQNSTYAFQCPCLVTQATKLRCVISATDVSIFMEKRAFAHA